MSSAKNAVRWLAVILTLVVLAGAGAVGYRQGWYDDWLGRESTPSAAPEPWQQPVPSPTSASATTGSTPTTTPIASRVQAALRGQLSAADLGPHVVAQVSALDGTVLASRGTGAATPASTTKLLTAAAALQVYGAEATFATTLVSPAAGQVILVGGGDPLLASTPVKDAAVPRADLTTLARAAATALAAQGVSRVRLSYDDSLFTGPATSPTWPADYVTDDVVSPLSALRADEGRTAQGRDLTPALTATRTVAAVLRSSGIRVVGRPRAAAASATSTATEVARVTSAPLRDLVQHTLETSDNDAAETLAHLVGAKAGDGSFAGGVTATLAALADLGVPTAGITLHDGSGLSRDNRITATALSAVLRVATTDADLQSLAYGLPVAGFSGSLDERFTDASATPGLGVVRAKTGTLTGVSALAGFVTDADGATLIYVVLADRVPETKTLAARSSLDDAAAALARCHCAAPSADHSSATVAP